MDKGDCMSRIYQLLSRIDREGVLHTVPLDLVRDVYKDGELIWRRRCDR
jgi:hypothetical protein